jgi:hypothetical protein
VAFDWPMASAADLVWSVIVALVCGVVRSFG